MDTTSTLTLQSLSDTIEVTQLLLDDQGTLLQSTIGTVQDAVANITALQNPPIGVPLPLTQWFNHGHSITEVDTILNTAVTTLQSSVTTDETNITTLQSGLATEITNRTTADATLQTSINGLQSQVTTNLATLTQEISDRSALAALVAQQFDTLNDLIEDADASISTESTARITTTNSLSSQLATLSASMQTVQTQITLLQGIGVDPEGALASQITTLTSTANNASTATASETTSRKSADTALQASINAVSASLSSITSGLTAEATTRAAADSSLTSAVNTINTTLSGIPSSIASETAARIAADATLTSNVSTLTTNVTANTAAIAAESTARANADTNLNNSVNTLQTNLSTLNASLTSINTVQNTIKANYGVVLDGGGYVQAYQVLSENNPPGTFNLTTLNNNVKLFNVGYTGKYFAPIAVMGINLPTTYDTQYGTATNQTFHDSGGTSHVVHVNVYQTSAIGINDTCFRGVGYSGNGDIQRLGQVLTTFKVSFRGTVNRYLSLWYRIKTGAGSSNGTWFPVSMADNTFPGARTYEPVSREDVVQISVTDTQVVEFGMTVLNTADCSINDSSNDNIYGGSFSVTALNMVTVS